MKLSNKREQHIIKTLKGHNELIDTLTKNKADHNKVMKAWLQYQAYAQGLKDALGLNKVHQLEAIAKGELNE
jgi:hypothetical protein